MRRHEITHVMNAVDPRFVMPIFTGALAGGADYLGMAMSLSQRHPEHPYSQTGVKLGDEQFAAEQRWKDAGRLALVGIGVEPGARDGSNLTVDGYEFAPVVLHLDHDRGVPQSAGHLGGRSRMVHHRTLQQA